MKKASSTLFPFIGSWLVVLTFMLGAGTGASAQCTLVCNNLVQVSLDATCESEILPDMVLEGGGCPNGNLQVQAKINGVWVPSSGNFVATSSNINQTIQVRVRDLNSGNFCNGYIHVEDKLAPIISCSNITLSCAITTYSPSYLLDDLGISEAYPDVEDNCGSFTLTYIDTWNDLTCNGTINGLNDISAYVKRIWTSVDQSGNSSSCTQYIYFARKHVTQVIFPADITVDCSNPATTPDVTGTPYVLDFGQEFPIFPGNTFCEMNASYTDQILPICDGTWKVLRTWVVYDWCLPTTPPTNPSYHIQIIKVSDSQGPEVECPDNMTVSTNTNDCQGDIDLPDIMITDNCSRIASIQAQWIGADGAGHSMYGTLTNFPGNNLWNPDTLGVFGIAANLPLGVTPMKYIVTDNCGNSTVCNFDITVEDGMPPVVACDAHTVVSLTVDGMALVNAITFDDGSYDDCSPDVYFKARRMDTSACQNNDKFLDQVKFCCSDLGDTITVILRVYDVPVPSGPVDLDYEEWHSNDCMVQVIVNDKLKPTCTPPAHVTVNCENFDPSLWAYGKATATDNCCIDTIITTASFSLFDTLCNKGTITRTFRAYDCGGQSSQCTQRIVVNYNQDYYVKFPNDVIVTSCDGTGSYGAPVFYGKDCELLGVSYEDAVFTVVPDACYKIERTWKIINWCTYNPDAPCVNVPNPNPNATSNSPQNLPGPIVSACGTPAPWNPTVVALTPGAPPTNFCNYYNPNANCYVYKQIIKIIDTQKPVINCPASPVEFCDQSPNNPQLWNESYWYDSVHGLHDLCEGAAPLTITATDSCSGANIDIRYLLFLDLDGDGTMETVINSNNTPAPGTVNFGNAGNVNYAGGTPRTFDERPVTPNDVYRWALHQSVSGKVRTASVQWKTFSQLPTPANQFGSPGVAPELPYGTHKIKWYVADGCGNEQTCEYTFVVKDCKAPTVVCLNGLSVNIMPTQMVQLWASDFLQYAEDNCTPPTSTVPGPNQLVFGIRKAGTGNGFPLDALGNPITSVTFTCAELGMQNVELWAMDKAGNADFCQTTVDVQDNLGSCIPGAPAVAGFLKTEMQEGVEDANVKLAGIGPNGQAISLNDLTDNLGTYMFPSGTVPVGSNFSIAPLKDDNPLNGVSTFDLVQINKHILGIQPLNSPYKMIAADANHSNSITTFDVVEIRKLILGIYSSFPNNTSWRFVNKDFVFPDPKNPFTVQFPETVDITDMQFGLTDEFVSIKVGDVNNTAIPNSFATVDDRSAGTLYFDLDDRDVKAGETFDVHFKSAEKTAGYQFTLNTGGLEVLEIIPGERMKTDNFAVFNDAVTASVDGDAGEFSIRFRASRSGQLSRMIGFSNRITRAESYTETGDRNEVALRFNGAAGPVVTSAGFELLQNTPNPLKSTTSISFNLPEATGATLTISNAEGRILKVLKGNYAKGFNTVTLNRADLEAGILFYQLDTPANSAVKKMIVVD